MSWLTENPWPLSLLFAGVAVVLLIVGEAKLRWPAIAGLALAVMVFVTELLIVTPGEQLEEALQTMLESFRTRNEPAITSLIADQSPQLKAIAHQGLEQVELHASFHMKDVSIAVADDGKSADVLLRANGTLTLRSMNSLHFASTRWKTRWILADTRWKLAEVHRLNPVTGEEIGVLAAQ